MDFLELINEAVSTLKTNRLRTVLAALGIVIGIGSVIALISLGQASQSMIESQIQSLGANLLTVIPGSQRSGAVRGAMGGSTTLTKDDAAAISQSSQITTVKTVSPELSRRAQVTTGKNNTNTQVVGATQVYADVHKVSIATGTFISQRDVDSMSKVAVVGPQVVIDLFGENAGAVGQKLRISGQTFTIIGVTVSKGGSGFMNQDDVIYIPLTTAQKQIFGVDYLSSIALEAMSPDVMTEAQNQVEDNAVLVPLAAVQTQNGSSTVRVMKNGKVSEIIVEIGPSNDTQTEIISGINEGDEIVTSVSNGTAASSTRNSASPFGAFGGRGGAVIREIH